MKLPGWLVDLAYTSGWRGVTMLPEPAARWAFQSGADLVSARAGQAVTQLRRNLTRVVPGASEPELDRLVNAAMRSYARYWMETFRLPAMDHEQALARVVTDGADHLDAAIARGRGTVIALPHSGNWDIAALWLVRRGYRFTTVVERVRPESLYNRFVGYRESIGMEVLPLTGAGTSVLRTLTERLRARGVVCLVADRDLSSRGITVDFFGEPTRMPSGPSRLALATGAALVPVHLRYDGDGWGQWIGAPVELGDGPATARVQRGTQQLADLFATMIARHPADWHMLQRLWLADLDPARGEPTGQAAAGGLAAGGQAADGPAAGGQAADLL